MYKEIRFNLCAGTLILTLAITACSGGNSENTDATNMLEQAQQLVNAGYADKAIATLDSLQKAFPKEIATQRKAMHLRTIADSINIVHETATTDSAIRADSIIVTQLQSNFAYVKTKDMVEGYYVKRSLQATPLFNRTSIEPRVDEAGNIMLVSNLCGKRIKHTSLSASAAGQTVNTQPVPYDGGSNYRHDGDGTYWEMVTFHADKCEELCAFIASHSSNAIKLRYVGNSSHTITLSPQLTQAIAETYRYASALKNGKNATAKKIFLAKKRELNRKQRDITAQTLQ